jgi:hypothetical protein
MGKPVKCDSFTGESHGKYGKIMINIDSRIIAICGEAKRFE